MERKNVGIAALLAGIAATSITLYKTGIGLHEKVWLHPNVQLK